jgi:hypothetical protein
MAQSRVLRLDMPGDDGVTSLKDCTSDTTDDPIFADRRNFHKVELWTRDDRIEWMLFAETRLDKARAVFADYASVALRRGRPFDIGPECSTNGRRVVSTVGFENSGVKRSANRAGWAVLTSLLRAIQRCNCANAC